jgi:hypothetical protein
MRYIKLFEKWGINKELEDLTDEYMTSIKNNPKQNDFNFVLYHELGNYLFKLKIKELGGKTEGNITYDVDIVNGKKRTSNFLITLSDRNDKSTLLHELKHFDRIIRMGPDDGTIRKSLKWVNFIDNDFNPGIKSIFYLLNDDEFEAKYHGYYSKIDQYLEKNLIENPTREDVINQINFYLKLPECDKSYTYWKNNVYLKFSKFGDEKYIEKLFDLLINGEITPMIIPSLNMRELFTSVKTYIRQKLGIKTKLEKQQIERAIDVIEKLVNKNKEKYRKKFNRIYSIMVDKYVN